MSFQTVTVITVQISGPSAEQCNKQLNSNYMRWWWQHGPVEAPPLLPRLSAFKWRSSCHHPDPEITNLYLHRPLSPPTAEQTLALRKANVAANTVEKCQKRENYMRVCYNYSDAYPRPKRRFDWNRGISGRSMTLSPKKDICWDINAITRHFELFLLQQLVSEKEMSKWLHSINLD